MSCERCCRRTQLLSFYDDLTDLDLTLCDGCFRWFANGRRKGGLPVPNARRLHDDRNTI